MALYIPPQPRRQIPVLIFAYAEISDISFDAVSLHRFRTASFEGGHEQNSRFCVEQRLLSFPIHQRSIHFQRSSGPFGSHSMDAYSQAFPLFLSLPRLQFQLCNRNDNGFLASAREYTLHQMDRFGIDTDRDFRAYQKIERKQKKNHSSAYHRNDAPNCFSKESRRRFTDLSTISSVSVLSSSRRTKLIAYCFFPDGILGPR